MSLFVAGAVFGEIWHDSRSAKCCIFQYKMLVVGVKGHLGCEAGCGLTVSWSDHVPSVSESQTSDAIVNNITVDPSLNLHYFAETHPTSVSAVHVNTSTLPQYPTLWAPSFDQSLLVQNIPHQNQFNPCYQLDTGTTSHYCYDAVPGISSAITSYQSPNNSQSHLQSQKSANTCLSTSMSPGIITSFPQPATRPCLFPNTINNHNLPTSAQHPSTVQPGSYVGNTHIPIPQHAPVPIASINPPLASSFVPSRMSMDPNILIKKMSLSTFSGQRKDWAEFKAVWKSVAEAVYANRTALAHELKRSVKGEASKRIRSVYVTNPEAYDLMWRKLESHYEDVGASVQAALEDLHKLKAVKEENYKGLVELIDETEVAYSQLEELGRLNILTMRDVDMISELLPSNLKAEWRCKYRDMSPYEKVSLFNAFMKFLDGEREAVARVAEAQVKRKNNDQRINERRRQYGYHVKKQASSKYY